MIHSQAHTVDVASIIAAAVAFAKTSASMPALTASWALDGRAQNAADADSRMGSKVLE